MKIKLGLILKIMAVVIIFLASMADMADNVPKLLGYSVICILLIFILFDTYRMKQYNYKLFYLAYLSVLALQGITLMRFVVLVLNETFSPIKGLLTYMMVFGLILIFISHIFAFIMVYKLPDKTQITSFYSFKREL